MVPANSGEVRYMWFLAGLVMLAVGVAVAATGGTESHGAFTPANVALGASVLSLLVLPAERSVRR
jgi:hypothetical protein